MKTTEEILNSTPVFLELFDSQDSVYKSFEDATYKDDYVPSEGISQYRVLFAWYEYEDYSGSAFVLSEKDGQLYENHGSHCSCYGLEDQWQPEPVVLKELESRLKIPLESWERNEYRLRLKEFLGITE